MVAAIGNSHRKHISRRLKSARDDKKQSHKPGSEPRSRNAECTAGALAAEFRDSCRPAEWRPRAETYTRLRLQRRRRRLAHRVTVDLAANGTGERDLRLHLRRKLAHQR